ncbi:ABC transporter substrate-binding protein [Paracoccus denitrificans]|uniref:ABC transporter substrate-binding protein n=1 Tax=Paracoccus denitrificans TaxID=266 RepID=UPI001E4C27E6|nr:ABC transporter substrate-binding protein [Paracoccus denitrificans]UFS67213.1 ABC transporter substrate-binding protein [Paracoccus denitrificans]
MNGSRMWSATLALTLLAAAASAEGLPDRVIQPDETPDGFDLDALIDAARKEPPLVVYNMTGKVKGEAERFAAAYGVKAEGVKIELGAVDKVAREAESRNVIGDVLINDDLPVMAMELMARGQLTNWVPGDMADKIPPEHQYPLQLHYGHFGWIYNTEVHDACPLDNIWQMTEPEQKGLVAIADPLANPKYPYWFDIMAERQDQELRELYRQRYGEELQTDLPTAAHEWVKRLAQNAPKVTRTDEEVSEAVGASGQTRPAVGFVSMAKFRNVAGKGYKMALCDTLRPYPLQSFPNGIAIASGTKSPNAAKLFVHFMFTEEGFSEERSDGKVSANSNMALPQDPSGVAALLDRASPYLPQDVVSNYETRPEWEDFWLTYYN